MTQKITTDDGRVYLDGRPLVLEGAGGIVTSQAGDISRTVLTITGGGGTGPRVGTTASSATPSIDTDSVDCFSITALAVDITSMTTNLTGTPGNFQILRLAITDNGTSRAITWGTKFESSTTSLPTATTISTRMDIGLVWNTVTSKWRCLGVA